MKYPIFYPSNLKSKTISYSFPYNLLRYFFKSTNLLFYSLSVSFIIVSNLFISLSLSLSEFVIERSKKHGGNVRYTTFTELEESYAKEEIYPLDLKNAVARELSKVYMYSNILCSWYYSLGEDHV